jgi:hypothetical protein
VEAICTMLLVQLELMNFMFEKRGQLILSAQNNGYVAASAEYGNLAAGLEQHVTAK